MFKEGRSEQFAGLLVAVIAFCVYANSLGNGFVWDDTNVIVINPALQGSPLSLFNSIDTGRDTELTPYYRPLTILTFLIEERLHGLTPFLMHLVNVLLHTANAFLVYRLARCLMNDDYAALLAGLLFAVHPVNTESVDFLSGGRNTMLACFFVLMAYLMHRRSILSAKISVAFAGAAFFLAGLFSKETALAVFPFIIAQEAAPLRENASGSKLRAAIRLLPYGAAAACYLVMRWMTLSNFGIQTGIIPGFGSEKLQSMYKIPGLWTRLLDNLYIIPRYILTVIWPPSLSPRYFVPDDLHLFALPLFVAWLCIIVVLIWLLTRGRSLATLAGLFWLAVFWLPVSGIIPLPSAAMADRYFYVPAIGLWIIVADQFIRLLHYSAMSRRYGVVAASLVLLLLAALTIARNLDWKSDVTLFSRFVEENPERAFGHHNLGTAYLDIVGDLDLAEKEFKKALALDPFFARLHTQMGYIRLLRADYEGALLHYDEAVMQNPFDAEAHLNRGVVLENLGRHEEALTEYRRFLAAPGNELAKARPYAEDRIRELAR